MAEYCLSSGLTSVKLNKATTINNITKYVDVCLARLDNYKELSYFWKNEYMKLYELKKVIERLKANTDNASSEID